MREEALEREVEEILGLRDRKEKDSELYKIANEVFDRTTKETLAYLHRRGKIEELHGVISTGKEANVFAGVDSEGNRIAVKIYRTYTTEFRRIWEYLAADPASATCRRTCGSSSSSGPGGSLRTSRGR